MKFVHFFPSVSNQLFVSIMETLLPTHRPFFPRKKRNQKKIFGQLWHSLIKMNWTTRNVWPRAFDTHFFNKLYLHSNQTTKAFNVNFMNEKVSLHSFELKLTGCPFRSLLPFCGLAPFHLNSLAWHSWKSCKIRIGQKDGFLLYNNTSIDLDFNASCF